MSTLEPHRMGQPRQGAAAPPATDAAQPQYEQDDELPEHTGSGPGGAPRPGSPMKNGQRSQSQPGAGASTVNA